MARIFNSIRQRLLKENRLTRYVVYAVGEIFLVMIGILLALQVNNWNTARSERHKEVKYLRSLKHDLQVDLVNLHEMIDLRRKKTNTAISLLSFTLPKDARGILAMDSMVWVVFGWKDYHPRTNTLKELTNTGDLGLIRSDSIKAILLDIEQANAEVVTSVAHMRREYDEYLYDRAALLREQSPFRDIRASYEQLRAVNDTAVTAERTQELTTQSGEFLKDRVVRNGLRLAAGNNSYIRGQYESILSDTQRLITLIDKDLNTP